MILFENFKEIQDICQKYGIRNYTINSDGLVDVRGNVELSYKKLTQLPLKFGTVLGSFHCEDNFLTTLEGSPLEVGRNFWCHSNCLTTLEGCSKKVGRDFVCHNNQLTTLKGGPQEVGEDFWCHNNLLTTLEGSVRETGHDFYCFNNKLVTLEGGPKKVGRNFWCYDNNLVSLEGGPDEVGGSFRCSGNPIYRIVGLFKDYEEFKTLLDDYSYLRGNKIIRVRFQEACIEAGIEMPQKIEGYDIA